MLLHGAHFLVLLTLVADLPVDVWHGFADEADTSWVCAPPEKMSAARHPELCSCWYRKFHQATIGHGIKRKNSRHSQMIENILLQTELMPSAGCWAPGLFTLVDRDRTWLAASTPSNLSELCEIDEL